MPKRIAATTDGASVNNLFTVITPSPGERVVIHSMQSTLTAGTFVAGAKAYLSVTADPAAEGEGLAVVQGDGVSGIVIWRGGECSDGAASPAVSWDNKNEYDRSLKCQKGVAVKIIAFQGIAAGNAAGCLTVDYDFDTR